MGPALLNTNTMGTILYLSLLIAAFSLCWLQSMDESMSNSSQQLRVCAWNSRGLGASAPYLHKLLDMSDIVCLAEHQLYPMELNRLNELSYSYCGFGRSSESLKPENYGHVPGHCGVAILWRKELSTVVRPLKDLGTFCLPSPAALSCG